MWINILGLALLDSLSFASIVVTIFCCYLTFTVLFASWHIC